MISVVHRREYGFKDDFEGYLFVKDQVPFAQLHLYQEYHTFFWRGQAALTELGPCLTATVREVSRNFSIPLTTMNSGRMQLARENTVEDFTFVVEADYSEVPHLKVGESEEDFESFVTSRAASASFARFDVESGRRLPLILWADLTDTESAEVGFSSLSGLPSPIVELLRDTCLVKLSEADLKDVRGQVEQRTPVPV